MDSTIDIIFWACAVIVPLWFARSVWKDQGLGRWQRIGLSTMLMLITVMGMLHIAHALHAGWATLELLRRFNLLLLVVVWCRLTASWWRSSSLAVRFLTGLFTVGMIGSSLFEETAKSGLAWHGTAWLGMTTGGAVLLGIWYAWYKQIAKTQG